MSDIATKPEEKPVVETPKVDEAAAPLQETTATTVTDAPAVVEEAKTEETPAEVKAEEEEAKEEKPEPKEITHGILSKNHGGLLAFFKQKRFFYFQDDAIPEDKLKAYLQKESHAKSTAAFATQTGKGLLLYSKDESNKVPHGIIKLADVTDVLSVGATKFVLKQTPHGELHFEAPAQERDSWVFTLKSKIADAKAADEAITESEEYKAALEKFTRPAVVAVKAAEKPTEEAKETETEEAKVDSAEKADTEAAPAVEGEAAESKDVKRSASTSKKAKRTSVFTSFFDKKEKAAEEKKEEVKEENEEAKEAETPAVAAVSAEPATEATEPVKSEEAEEAKPVEAKASEATTPKEATSPKTTKRLSFFGGFNKKKAESAPAVEKTEEDKAETPAPTVTDAPAVVEPTETETEAVDAAAETAAAPEKLTASSPPKSSKFNLSSFIKREKSPAPKAEEKAVATEAPTLDEVVAPVEETPAPTVTDAPLVVEETPAKETSTEETPAEATSPKETKRKSSFFSGFKAKKSEETKGDEQTSESEAPKAKSGVLGGLIRKASRGGSKPAKEAEKEVAAPATVAEETETVGAEPIKTETETEASPVVAAAEPTQSIGDVVPDAVTVGQAPVKTSA